MDFDYVIVGAGLSGLTIAERIANELDEKVLIIEKRDHIGGNIYDYYVDGILVQKYGPHIFHTSEKKVYDYLSQFTQWMDYKHKVLSYVDGEPVDLDESSEKDVVLKNKLFKNYIKKQWGSDASKLTPSAISTIFNHDQRYFTDTYNGMPKEGFTKMCERMIESDNIHVGLKSDYKKYIDKIKYDKLVYTGPVDYFYDYRYGELLYRCQNFVLEIHDTDSYQEAPVINYPNDYFFTRITEFKKLTSQKADGKTAIIKEYPGFNGELCYPYPTKEYEDRFKLYEAEMMKEENVIFAGRLAKYKYYTMDAVIKDALEIFENKIMV